MFAGSNSLRSKLSRARNLLRFLFPGLKDRAYVRRIRNSGQFDRTFYKGIAPSLHRVYTLNPELHYVLLGEACGLQPSGDFSPRAYIQHNPDLANSGLRPFEHYLTYGMREGRVKSHLPKARDEAVIPFPVLRPKAGKIKKRFAIVVHLYYLELWEEIAAQIQKQEFEFDLYVSYVKFRDDKGDTAQKVHEVFPDAMVVAMPNRGRDILPFLQFVNAGIFDGYEAVCKLHTKKSPHRTDGNEWRQWLIEGILGEPKKAKSRLSKFLKAKDVGFWLADGQRYEGDEWWGSNRGITQQILSRVEIVADENKLRFPAGSIYWVKPALIDLLRGLRLKPEHFQAENQQLDGTAAHGIERALGYLSSEAGLDILQTTELDELRLPEPLAKPAFVTAFYLPQFHPIAENNEWWGEGFTEWNGVTRAGSSFDGHHQPHLPSKLGFYDLRVMETLEKQATMARSAGVDAFCVYHYWFDGKRLLEKPLDLLLQRSDIDFPFYLCWANESWRRNWDGLSGEILANQSYTPGFAKQFAEDCAPYMKDPRYARPDGERPRFVIYRPDDMPDPAGAVAQMRETWRELGVGEVELGAVLFHIEGENPVPEGLFDFWVEMPPHGIVKSDAYLFGGPQGNQMPVNVAGNFEGLIYSYKTASEYSTSKSYGRSLPANTIAGIMPSWDNTARRGLSAHLAYGANPASFRTWFARLIKNRLSASYRQEVWINAWNEWAEKAILEPSDQYEDAHLNVVKEFCAPEKEA